MAIAEHPTTITYNIDKIAETLGKDADALLTHTSKTITRDQTSPAIGRFRERSLGAL